jgi:4-amino-4-deoxy-L-arabinose transferase-like glycosyltransferase
MNIKYNKALWLIIILAIVMMIPVLGLTDFNTKGEPREAVVAYTMLEHGNWILPINNGGDIPYKPPFFHWCIAFFSLFIGHVNEYTSRLPSAVSLVLMTIGGFVFYAKRKNAQTSLIAAILTLTAFEVHRAGMNCRVDMLNTAFMVGAMYLLYRWWEKGKHQLPWLAILCMSGATLTKGPVGIILPCFVMGVFMLTQRENFWGIVWRMALTALLSLIIPFCWYYAAYLQGGDEFLRLVKASREPWYKNTIFVIQADHGKLVGKSEGELPQSYNHIPLIIFGPGVPQQQYAGLGMQVDVMPTLFGLMNLNYEYEGFGVDLLKQQRPMVFYSADNQIVARDHQRCFVYNPSMNRSFCYDVLPNGNLKETKQESKFQDLKNYVFSNIQAAEYIERHQQ